MINTFPSVFLVMIIGRVLIWLIDKAAENYHRQAQILDLIVLVVCFATIIRWLPS
jgi:hypothetical protein